MAKKYWRGTLVLIAGIVNILVFYNMYLKPVIEGDAAAGETRGAPVLIRKPCTFAPDGNDEMHFFGIAARIDKPQVRPVGKKTEPVTVTVPPVPPPEKVEKKSAKQGAQTPAQELPSHPADDIVLVGTVFSAPAADSELQQMAILKNSKTGEQLLHKVNDTVAGCTIVRIAADAVTLQFQERTIEKRIFDSEGREEPGALSGVRNTRENREEILRRFFRETERLNKR